jgi:uncharacterized membrane protein
MDFMIAWFPLMKWTFGVFSLMAIWYMFYKGFHKVGYILLIIVIIFLWFVPVKHDGSQQYKSVTSDAKEIHTQ